ncbi:phage tail protein I [Brevundimonas vitis]|uniref:Phage tail protein I n=1 Tax=Brevundimonas vitisensis TaxID=2800818 RepID=A0ABX7BQG1_9CAUL|nr:phage tail protein I [Brevundimonas vitisensis]QQQ17745.1 phage tail protein I [Brevundimonas vitisensis]
MSEPRTLLPPNATPLEAALERALARRLDELPTPIRDAWDADTIALDTLPWLAWAVGRRTWNADWPEAVRRAIVRDAIITARRLGTVQSVLDVIELVGGSQAFGGELDLVEWWQTEPKGEPGTFSVTLSIDPEDGPPPAAAFVDELIDEVSEAKPRSRHFTLTQALGFDGGIDVVGAVRPMAYARMEFAQRPPLILTIVTDDGDPVIDAGGATLFLEQ